MKIFVQHNEHLFVDVTCEKTDEIVGVEIQKRPHGKMVLYICVNEQTILRINRIPKLSLIREEENENVHVEQEVEGSSTS